MAAPGELAGLLARYGAGGLPEGSTRPLDALDPREDSSMPGEPAPLRGGSAQAPAVRTHRPVAPMMPPDPAADARTREGDLDDRAARLRIPVDPTHPDGAGPAHLMEPTRAFDPDGGRPRPAPSRSPPGAGATSPRAAATRPAPQVREPATQGPPRAAPRPPEAATDVGERILEVASPLRRGLAVTLDAAVLAAVTAAAAASGLLGEALVPALAEGVLRIGVLTARGQLDRALLFVAVFALVFPAASHAVAGKTPGKLACNLELVRSADGERPGPGRAALRAVAALFGAVLAEIGYSWILLDRRQRALHDVLAGTVVVRARPRPR
jgi:uncharacterized RDD family membrane protein YckC